MAAAPAIYRLIYRDAKGRRCTKYVPAHSPDGAIGQAPDAVRFEAIQKTHLHITTPPSGQ